jgi:hypothetical protein
VRSLTATVLAVPPLHALALDATTHARRRPPRSLAPSLRALALLCEQKFSVAKGME